MDSKLQLSQRIDQAEKLLDSLEDPSLADGFRPIFDREVGVEVRSGGEPKEGVGELRTFKVRLLILGKEEKPESVRMELSSEGDLFFHYYHTIDPSGFEHMRTRQKLVIKFKSYAGVLISTLNRCVKQPQTYMGLLHINQNGTARLDFIQNIDFKFVDILSVRFTKSPEEFVRDLVTFRYRMAKEQVARLKAKLVGMNKMLKLRNPSLLLQMGKILPKSGESFGTT